MQFTRRGSRIIWTALAVACINFASFTLIAGPLGGSPATKESVNGRYFLASHGRLTEVSRAVYRYSGWHGFSVIVTHCAAIATGWALYLTGDVRIKSSGQTPDETSKSD